MKKLYSLFAAVVLAATVNAQAFTATYDFVGTPPSVNGVVAGSNVTSSPFSSTGYTSTTTGDRYAWSGAPTATTADLGKYFEVTVTPASGYQLSVNSVNFRIQRSGTGPRYYSVRSSVNGYAANLPASISPANAELEVIGSNEFHYVNDIATGQNGSTVSPAITNQTSPVTFRFYFYGSEAAGGTFSVDDVVITGTADTVLGVSDNSLSKNALVKNTIINNTILFAAKADVQLVSMSGQVIKSASVNENTALDVSSLEKGFYFVTGMVNGQKVAQKIIKK